MNKEFISLNYTNIDNKNISINIESCRKRKIKSYRKKNGTRVKSYYRKINK